MNIFLRELKANLKSLLIWSGMIVLFVIVGFSKFSAYYGNPELLAIFDAIPAALVDAMNLKAFNLTTVTGFLGIMYTYFALILSISAGMWGTNIITKEERDKTVEFSLVLPVTRQKLITAKIFAAVANSIVLLLVTWLSTLVMAQNYQPDSGFNRFLMLMMAAIFVLQMIFLSIGIFLGCALKHYKRASSTAVMILLGTYILSVFTSLSPSLDFLKYFTPFNYFNPVNLLNQSRMDIGFLLLSAGIITAAYVGAFVTYKRRDMYI